MWEGLFYVGLSYFQGDCFWKDEFMTHKSQWGVHDTNEFKQHQYQFQERFEIYKLSYTNSSPNLDKNIGVIFRDWYELYRSFKWSIWLKQKNCRLSVYMYACSCIMTLFIFNMVDLSMNIFSNLASLTKKSITTIPQFCLVFKEIELLVMFSWLKWASECRVFIL